MKKLLAITTIFALFITTSLFAIDPSILINGQIPYQDNIFQVKYNDSDFDLTSGEVSSSGTDFKTNLETDSFDIYIANYSSSSESPSLSFSSVGFEKLTPDTTDNQYTTEGDPLDSIQLKINMATANSSSVDISPSGTYNLSSTAKEFIFTVPSNADYSTTPAATFYFLWNAEDSSDPIPAGDYLAQVVVEYTSGD
ncbi:MAG: hypothetical protein ACRQFF_07745 [Sphaerochaeta sp.]